METKIRVSGAGIGTVRLYYAYTGVSCNAGYAVYVNKYSGNVNYPDLPLSGYFDVILTSADQGSFWFYTRCLSGGSYVGNYGIDSLWYLLVEPATPTPTPTLTSTGTATSLPTNTPEPYSGLTNAYRWLSEANSAAYSAIVTGDPTIRSDPTGQWSYMRVAVQRIINGNVYFAEIGWVKGAQASSNFIPRSYWAYRNINDTTDEGWEGYPGIGIAYNYMVKRTASETWGLYFNDLNTPDQTIWLGWDTADRIFSGGEVPNGSQGMGDSDNINVQYLDPTGSTWFNACNTVLLNEDPSRYFVDAGGNCSSWRVYGNN